MSHFENSLLKIDVVAKNKTDLFEMMVEDFFQGGIISNKERFLSAIWERENIFSTGIGYGIAIPHARQEDVKEFKIGLYILKNNLEYESVDNLPVRIVFMLAVPIESHKEYISVLSLLSKAMHLEENRNFLLNCSKAQDILDFLRESIS